MWTENQGRIFFLLWVCKMFEDNSKHFIEFYRVQFYENYSKNLNRYVPTDKTIRLTRELKL